MTDGAPLEEIRVVDFTAAAAGPICAMILGDFGADVLKIEPPGGEHARRWGSARFGEGGEFSALFLAYNRNKRGLTLDLKTPAGQERVHQELAEADVVIESFKPGVAERLGIDYSTVAEYNPTVVYCSISGFGQTGPLAARPGFDTLMQAYAGHLSLTGEPDRPSARIGPSSIDTLTGTHAALGVLLALRHRDRTGEGQWIDTSLYDSALHMISHYLADYTGTGVAMGKSGTRFGFLAPYGIFDAADREFYMGIHDDRMWRRLCRALARDELEGERFATNADRLTNEAELYGILLPLFRDRPAQAWVDLLVELEIPSSLVANVPEVAEQEQAVARDLLLPTRVDGVRSAGFPIKLSKSPARFWRSAPSLAEQAPPVAAEPRAR